MTSARLYDFQEYRRRQALRDCGVGSRPRDFLWLNAHGVVGVARFRPARLSATEALQHAGRAG